MSRLVSRALMVAALATMAPSVDAQSAISAGPRSDQSRVGVSANFVTMQSAPSESRALDIATGGPLLPQPAALRKRGVPQMVIGGVAIIGGAIIGDDVGTIVSLGGLAYGIYGLYLYLN